LHIPEEKFWKMTLRKLTPLIKIHFKLIADLEKAKWGGGGEETKPNDEAFSTVLSWTD